MKLQELYQFMGEWGRYQTRIFVFLSLPLILRGFQLMMAIVAFYIPQHRCQIPGWSNESYVIEDDRHRMLVNQTIPKDPHTDHGYSQCTIYSHWNATRDVNVTGSDDVQSCHSWVYDTTELDSTVITQFDLVCDKKLFRSHMNTIYLAGNVIGSPAAGFLCDWLGRKPIFLISTTLILIFGVAAAFPPSAEVFFVYRFLLGSVAMGVYISSYVLGIELVGPTKRTMAGSLSTILWLLGPLLLSILSFVVRDWQQLQLISALPLLLCLGYLWILPESPRWLLLNRKFQPAFDVIRKAAKVNGKPLPPSLESILENEPIELEDQHVGSIRILQQLCSHSSVLIKVLIIFFNWFVTSFAFYGLSLNVSNLAGSLRINFLVSCAVEFAGSLVAWALLENLGRKRSHCCFLLLTALACLATIFTVSFGGKELQWTTTALALVGKLGISASFTSIYLITTEVFPTGMRNFGLGCGSTIGKIGSVVSPYVADLSLFIEGRFSLAVPLVIFGGLTLLAAFSALFLPETLHRKLPDTLEDTLRFFNDNEDKTMDMDQDSETLKLMSSFDHQDNSYE